MKDGAILVTGGAGYIGSHTALALCDAGARVVVLDNLSTGDRTRVPAAATFVLGDVSDAGLVRRICAEHGVDTIMHFAGLVKVEESMREPDLYMRTNADYTKILARAAAEAGVARFIFSSSASVYGNTEENPINEDTPLSPINPYAESKKEAEAALRGVVAESRMRLGILRYFNVAGVDAAGRTGYGVTEQPTHLIRSAVRAFVRGEAFTIFGNDYPTPDGTCIRDYIHVSDIADAHVAVLHFLHENPTALFNCGSGRGYSNAEVVKAVQQVAGREFPVHYGPRRPGDPAALIADISRIKRTIGWQPRYGLEDMIRHELSWVQARMS